ncbi:MAG: lipopolysaccharide/colanic/teichoic acid biosynthesis glycosyltransferase [Myxococcota bacterium]|jgi:lipopolysaccharide/colanic/teichoic acid biosynthesis glycosyltransferase
MGRSQPTVVASQIAALDDPRLREVANRYSVDTLAGIDWLKELNLVEPRRGLRCLSVRERATKRAVDIVGASLLLVGIAPIMLMAAVLIKLTSPGPSLYNQTRTGLNRRDKRRDRRGKNEGPPEGEACRRRENRRANRGFGLPFTIYKFRSMRLDAEVNGPQFAQERDPRVTRLGRFLRKSRIDELPQLVNVLRGEMSLVGPRPERPEFIKELSKDIPGYLDRLGIKPGLTGLAQVANGYDVDKDAMRRKVRLDMHYLQNCSPMNDFRILLRTVSVVLTGKGAR